MVVYSIREFLWAKYLIHGSVIGQKPFTTDMWLLERSVLTHGHKNTRYNYINPWMY